MARSLRDLLNEANANKFPVAANVVKMGTVLALVPRFFRGTVTSNKLVLPNNAKAAVVLECWVTAGTVSGRFTAVQGAPATTNVAPNGSGDLVFFSTDAVTEVEVTYLAYEGTVYTDLVPVASNVGAPLAGRKARALLAATALVGTTLGAKTILLRTAAPSAGQASLNLLGSGVTFATADAVTQASITYVACPGQGTEDNSRGTALDTADKDY